MSAVAIAARGLSKTYKVYGKPSDLLREIFGRSPRHTLHKALDDVSFEMLRGECVGIIGPNGAGKSTLLKMIAGTLSPSAGALSVSGRVSAILELGTGFHPEYSGRDNVFLGGMCLGMSREEMARKYDWIVAFSELGAVIDQPFKTYSSGMQARLTFATAISVDPEILIIDEALAAGDSYFVVKCGRRIREICASGATVLFVSHSTHQVATLCTRAIWIEGGRVREIGDAIDVCRRYDYAVHERISGGTGKVVTAEATEPQPVVEMADTVDHIPPADEPEPAAPPIEPEPEPQQAPAATAGYRRADVGGLLVLHDEIFRRGPLRITRTELLGADGLPVDAVHCHDPLTLRVHYRCERPEELADDTLGLAVAFQRRHDTLLVAQMNTVNPVRDEGMRDYDQASFRTVAGHEGYMEARFPAFELMAGDYLLSTGLLPNRPGTSDFYEYHHQRYLLTVQRTGYPSGAVIYHQVEWRHEVEKA
ncbi:MAG: hypothetical protein DI629_16630 [Mesorhizobium amorphae]|nr:MAG: hypothetical protein DI629_16630 [Mesorhizobium amorphae]